MERSGAAPPHGARRRVWGPASPRPRSVLSALPPHPWRCLSGLRYFGKASQIWALQAERVLCRCCQSKRENLVFPTKFQVSCWSRVLCNTDLLWEEGVFGEYWFAELGVRASGPPRRRARRPPSVELFPAHAPPRSGHGGVWPEGQRRRLRATLPLCLSPCAFPGALPQLCPAEARTCSPWI